MSTHGILIWKTHMVRIFESHWNDDEQRAVRRYLDTKGEILARIPKDYPRNCYVHDIAMILVDETGRRGVGQERPFFVMFCVRRSEDLWEWFNEADSGHKFETRQAAQAFADAWKARNTAAEQRA